MLDKNLIKSNFKKHIETYENNAFVQRKTAKKLIQLLNKKKFKNILEIGSYTGFLTRIAIKELKFESYLAFDIIDSFDCIKKLHPKIKFQQGDIETFELNETYDLIISSASLQWCDDFKKVLTKLKKHSNTLAIATFGKENLLEIKNIFNLGLNYPSIEEIKKILPNANIFSEFETLKFNSSLNVLRHLKLTGVNSLSSKISYKQIKQNLSKLDKEYNNTITYNPIYILS